MSALEREMSQLISQSPGPVQHPAPAGGMARQQSLLFPSLFSKVCGSERLRVLEVGPAFPETLKFFSVLKCRLHFANLYDQHIVRNGGGDTSDAELVKAFKAALGLAPGEQLDLCLLWDFPAFLDDRCLRAFSQALEPHLHARSRAHGFAVRTADTRLNHRWYGIDQPHLFTVRTPWIPNQTLYPHSQAILINLLTCFDIDRGMLLPDGRLEVEMTRSRPN